MAITYDFELSQDDQVALQGCGDDYQARNVGIKAFQARHPEPEPPAKPEPVETESPRVIKHDKGALWVELDVTGPRFRDEPQKPAVKLSLTIGDEVVVVSLSGDEVALLREQVEQTYCKYDKARNRFEQWQAEAGGHEDDKRAWQDACRAAGKTAIVTWRALYPDGRDDDEDDEAYDMPF